MYNQKPRNPIDTAINDSIMMFTTNWSKYDNGDWTIQMKNMMRASFKNWMPKSIKKASAHVIQTNTGSFPPSMGAIIQEMKKYMGTASLRTASKDQCKQCTKGLRRLVFWITLDDEPSKKMELNASCSGCELGKSRKTRMKMLDEIETMQKIKNKELYAATNADGEKYSLVNDALVTVEINYGVEIKRIEKQRYIWLQTQTDELPPLFYISRDIRTKKPLSNEAEQLRRAKEQSKIKHMKNLMEIKKKLQQKERLKLVENNQLPTPIDDEIQYINLDEYLYHEKLKAGVKYIYAANGIRRIIDKRHG